MFDFQNAQPPQLAPLRYSFTVDDIENDLKKLFIDLFDAYLANDVFDTNVIGMAHLGSLALVRRMVNVDGLVLIGGEREEAAARYLYRAWKSRNLQGRGLYFLKTYLQLLFPNSWTVDQQVQVTASAYPTALLPAASFGNDSDKYLTSRIKITVSAQSSNSGGISGIAQVIKDIIPARMVPDVTLSESSNTQFRLGSFVTAWAFLNTEGTTI